MLDFQEKKSLRISIFTFSFLLFFTLFIFFPWITEATTYSAGWYSDRAEKNDSYQEGFWRADIKVYDDLGNPLQADSITIKASWYEYIGAAPIDVYKATFYNTSTILTGNIDAVKNPLSGELEPNYGIMELTVKAFKTGYYDMTSSNYTRKAGLDLNKINWIRNLYLARGSLQPNIAYVFPTGEDQWFTNSSLAIQVYVRKRPNSDNIEAVKTEAININTSNRVYSEITNLSIAEGTTTLPTQFYPDGIYTWRVSLMKDNKGFLYSEPGWEMFKIDTIPPVFDSYAINTEWTFAGGRMVPLIRGEGIVKDSDSVSVSGIENIEWNIEDGYTYTYYPAYTCPEETEFDMPKVYDRYTPGETYNYYLVATDCAGNEKTAYGEFTVDTLKPSLLRVASYIAHTSVPGAYIEHVSGPLETGNNTTTYSFETTSIYTFSIRAPASHIDPATGNTLDFSFWLWCGPWDKDTRITTLTVYPNTQRLCVAVYGTSRLFFRRYIDFGDPHEIVSEDLKDSLYYNPVGLKQISGTPSGLIDTEITGDPYNTSATSGKDGGYYGEWIKGTFEDVVVHAEDSDDGVLKFDGRWWPRDIYGTTLNCDTPSGDCQLSVNYSYVYVYMYYVIERTVDVKSIINGVATPGVPIVKISGLIPSNLTPYSFKSTSTIPELNSELEAPLDFGGENFTYWEGCDDFGGIKNNICILREGGWATTTSRTITAHYGNPPEIPAGSPTKVGELKVQPAGGGGPITIALHDIDDDNLYFIKEGITTEGPLRVSDKDGNIKAIDLLPLNDPNASPVRIKTDYTTTSVPDGIWSLRKWFE